MRRVRSRSSIERANGVVVAVTYSIVARDREAGQLGVAVQTCMPAVGAKVPFARAGVGAVASQAFAEPSYGARCLDGLAAGLGSEAALADARAADPGSASRQVGVVGADGSVAAFTGEACIEHAGAVVGHEFAVQPNMMASADVWPAMADAYTGAEGSLARRLRDARGRPGRRRRCAWRDVCGDPRRLR